MKSRRPGRPGKMRLTYVGGMYLGSDQRVGAVGPRATCSEIPQTVFGQSEGQGQASV